MPVTRKGDAFLLFKNKKSLAIIGVITKRISDMGMGSDLFNHIISQF
jgi:hypothetical protein